MINILHLTDIDQAILSRFTKAYGVYLLEAFGPYVKLGLRLCPVLTIYKVLDADVVW